MELQQEYDGQLETVVNAFTKLERRLEDIQHALNNEDCRHAYELADEMLDNLARVHDRLQILKNLEQALIDEKHEGK